MRPGPWSANDAAREQLSVPCGAEEACGQVYLDRAVTQAAQFFANIMAAYEHGATREASQLEAMRAHVATTKQGIVAFKSQMAAEVAADEQRAAQSPPPGAAAAGSAPPTGLVAAASGAVGHIVATTPGKPEAQKSLDMEAIAEAYRAPDARLD